MTRPYDRPYNYYEVAPAWRDPAARLEALRQWIRDSGYDTDQAWRTIKSRYPCSWQYFNLVLSGQAEGSLGFYNGLSRIMGNKMIVLKHIYPEGTRPSRAKRSAPSRLELIRMKYEVRPLKPIEWVSRNLLKYDNAAVNWRMLRGNKLINELKEMGIDVKVTEGAVTGKPVLVRIQKTAQGNVGNETGDEKT